MGHTFARGLLLAVALAPHVALCDFPERIIPEEARKPPEYLPTLRHLRLRARDTTVGSLHLAAMHEPLLWTSPDAEETYRLLWMRSFKPAVVLRLERTESGGTLFVTEQRSTHDLRVRRTSVVELGPLEWALIEGSLNASGFWSATPPKPYGHWLDMRDGSTFVFEGRRGLAYRAVELRSDDIGNFGGPNAQRIMALRESWLLLMSLASLPVRAEDVD